MSTDLVQSVDVETEKPTLMLQARGILVSQLSKVTAACTSRPRTLGALPDAYGTHAPAFDFTVPHVMTAASPTKNSTERTKNTDNKMFFMALFFGFLVC
ncbi:hypothetical protein Q3G72_001617 [Acer saccharum]|nr:hypothetical protein Q3G72_001617 [Acer saccharum]